jgi:3-oxoacyl-(acyl-carrier-protein) synthase
MKSIIGEEDDMSSLNSISGIQAAQAQSDIVLSLLKTTQNFAAQTQESLINKTVDSLNQMMLSSVGIGKNFNSLA